MSGERDSNKFGSPRSPAQLFCRCEWTRVYHAVSRAHDVPTAARRPPQTSLQPPRLFIKQRRSHPTTAVVGPDECMRMRYAAMKAYWAGAGRADRRHGEMGAIPVPPTLHDGLACNRRCFRLSSSRDTSKMRPKTEPTRRCRRRIGSTNLAAATSHEITSPAIAVSGLGSSSFASFSSLRRTPTSTNPPTSQRPPPSPGDLAAARAVTRSAVLPAV